MEEVATVVGSTLWKADPSLWQPLSLKLIDGLDHALGRPPFPSTATAEVMSIASALRLLLQHIRERGRMSSMASLPAIVKTLPVITAALVPGSADSKPDVALYVLLIACVAEIVGVEQHPLSDLLVVARTLAPSSVDVFRLHSRMNAVDADVMRFFLSTGAMNVGSPPVPAAAASKQVEPRKKGNPPATPPLPPALVVNVSPAMLGEMCAASLSPAARKILVSVFDSPAKFVAACGKNVDVAASVLFVHHSYLVQQLSPLLLIASLLDSQTCEYFIQSATVHFHTCAAAVRDFCLPSSSGGATSPISAVAAWTTARVVRTLRTLHDFVFDGGIGSDHSGALATLCIIVAGTSPAHRECLEMMDPPDSDVGTSAPSSFLESLVATAFHLAVTICSQHLGDATKEPADSVMLLTLTVQSIAPTAELKYQLTQCRGMVENRQKMAEMCLENIRALVAKLKATSRGEAVQSAPRKKNAAAPTAPVVPVSPALMVQSIEVFVVGISNFMTVSENDDKIISRPITSGEELKEFVQAVLIATRQTTLPTYRLETIHALVFLLSTVGGSEQLSFCIADSCAHLDDLMMGIIPLSRTCFGVPSSNAASGQCVLRALRCLVGVWRCGNGIVNRRPCESTLVLKMRSVLFQKMTRILVTDGDKWQAVGFSVWLQLWIDVAGCVVTNVLDVTETIVLLEDHDSSSLAHLFDIVASQTSSSRLKLLVREGAANVLAPIRVAALRHRELSAENAQREHQKRVELLREQAELQRSRDKQTATAKTYHAQQYDAYLQRRGALEAKASAQLNARESRALEDQIKISKLTTAAKQAAAQSLQKQVRDEQEKRRIAVERYTSTCRSGQALASQLRAVGIPDAIVYSTIATLGAKILEMTADDVLEFVVSNGQNRCVPADVCGKSAQASSSDETANLLLVDFWGTVSHDISQRMAATSADSLETSSANNAATLPASFHKRIAFVLDVFNFQPFMSISFDEVVTVCGESIPLQVFSIILKPDDAALNGFVTIYSALQAAADKGLLHVADSLAHMTPLGAVYHRHFAKFESSFDFFREQKREILRHCSQCDDDEDETKEDVPAVDMGRVMFSDDLWD